MNASRKILLIVAAANIVLMLLFPPYDSIVIGRGAPTLDAFYFVFDRQYNKVVNTDLLFLQLIWVLLNALFAWLLLGDKNPGASLATRRTGTILFVVANLALILLFPPFENYASSSRFSGTYFDGFYFLFGDKWQRQIYVPLLYLEVLWVCINGAVLWLLFRDPPEAQGPGEDE